MGQKTDFIYVVLTSKLIIEKGRISDVKNYIQSGKAFVAIYRFHRLVYKYAKYDQVTPLQLLERGTKLTELEVALLKYSTPGTPYGYLPQSCHHLRNTPLSGDKDNICLNTKT